jgi:4-amino-4-deoxy-L-arabinose transferase-like glycosyltransferase
VSIRRLRAAPLPLVLLLGSAAILSLAWALSTPAFQAPDEEAHFAYAQHLSETGSPPSVNGGRGALSTEARTAAQTAQVHSLIGIPSARPAWTSADLRLWRSERDRLTASERADGSGPNTAGANPPLYYAYEAVPYRAFLWGDVFTRLVAMRLWTGLLTVLTVGMVWAIAGEIFGPDPWRRTLATGVVALQPMLGYIGSTVSPDAFLTAIWTAFLLIAVRTIRRGPTPARLLGLCALSAGSVLTHGRGLAILGPLTVVLLILAWRSRAVLGRLLRRRLVLAIGAVLVAAAPVLVWRLLHPAEPGGGGLYGSQATFAGTRFDVIQLLSHVWQFYLPGLGFMDARLGPPYGYRQVFIETFFGTFGSLEVTYPSRFYDALQWAVALGLGGLLVLVIARARSLRRNLDVVLVFAGAGLSLLFLLHLASYVNLLKVPSDPIFTGRYLLPLVSLFGLAVAWIVGALPRRASLLVGGAVLGVGVLMSLAGLGLSAARFYG